MLVSSKKPIFRAGVQSLERRGELRNRCYFSLWDAGGRLCASPPPPGTPADPWPRRLHPSTSPEDGTVLHLKECRRPSLPRPAEHSTQGVLRGRGERDAPRGADCAHSPRQDPLQRPEKLAQRRSWGNHPLSRRLPIIQRAVDKRWLRPRVSRAVLFPDNGRPHPAAGPMSPPARPFPDMGDKLLEVKQGMKIVQGCPPGSCCSLHGGTGLLFTN